MNIGIDARILERKMTGIGRFLNSLLKELPNVDKENKYFLFSYDNLRIKEDFYTNISTGKSSLHQKLFAPIWINFIIPKVLKQNKIDLFFSVNQLTPLWKLSNTKYILVLHDVIYKVDKTYHPFIYRKYLQCFTYFSIKKCDLIITVSNYSKQDILKHYSVSEQKIKVVYPAAENDFYHLNLSDREKAKVLNAYGAPDHIILYIGVIENRKNIIGIIKIADEVYTRNKKIKFLLIGRIGYGGEKILKEVLKRKNLIHIEYVDDDQLKKLYNVSTIFLFPSFYEGFGFPPLEAMQSGLPVLASNTTSLKEVIKSGGILHDPNDYKSFTDDIFKLIEDKEFYTLQKNKGIEQAREFNIEKTARELVNVYNSLKYF